MALTEALIVGLVWKRALQNCRTCGRLILITESYVVTGGYLCKACQDARTFGPSWPPAWVGWAPKAAMNECELGAARYGAENWKSR